MKNKHITPLVFTYKSGIDIPNNPLTKISKLVIFACGVLGSTSILAFTPELIGQEVTGEYLDTGDRQHIREGGIANDTTIDGSGRQDVHQDGTANNTTINGNGSQYITQNTNGITNNTTINDSAIQYVNGGVANSTTINNNGTQYVLSTANDTIVNNNGSQRVYGGGTSHNTIVNDDASQTVTIGGTSNGTIVNNNGSQSVSDENSIANNTTLNDSGIQNVVNSGTANGTIINDNAKQYVFNGGLTNNTTINGSGSLNVYDTSIANNTTVNDNANLTVLSGGELIGQTIINDNGIIRFYLDSTASGALPNSVTNNGELIFQRSNDYSLDFNLTGTGSLVQNGPHSLTLNSVNTYSGMTTVNNGELILGVADSIASSSAIQINGGTLNLNGYNQTVNQLTNSGNITMGDSAFNTLTVTGNYQGNGGLLVMHTQLEGDDALSDKLIVEGDTAGTTRVQVNNIGGSGAQTLNGIELIEVKGLSEGEFIQEGRIIAGAYDYSLDRGLGSNSNNWYLNSSTDIDGSDSMVERPEASGYSANLAAANNMFVTRLHDRQGETPYIDTLTGEQRVTSLWLRNEGGHNRSRDSHDQLSTQANRYVMQLGSQIAQWNIDDKNSLHLGIMAGYANSKSKTESRISGYSARASVDGYSAGLYGTWYANEADKSGLYVDSWAQYSWFNNTVDGQDLNTEEYKSKGVTASIESGYTFNIGENVAKNTTYFIQPKVQMTWMGVKADDHQETNGTNISGEGNGNIQTRLGVKAFMSGYSDQDKGKNRIFQPFVEASWIHNTKDFGTTMDDQLVKQDGAANIGELKMGLEGQINKSVNLWGNVGQQVGNKGYSDTAVTLGVKYTF